MKDLNSLFNQCMDEVQSVGIETGTIEEVTINYRSKKRFGQCRRTNGKYFISVNSEILSDKSIEKRVKQTIIHEILHTVKGCMNHGEEWKKVADLMNDCYNYNISRCSSYSDFGLKREEIVKPKEYKYIYRCKCCGQIIKRQRKTDFVNHYTCGKCNGNFEEIS